MALFCIPQNLVQKLKDSALKGEINIKELYEMSSKQRREFFAKHTDAELGKFINTEFEKAMVAKQKDAITDWAKSVFNPEAQTKPVYKNIVDKINALGELGVLTPKAEKAFLQDLVSDKLGANVTAKEIAIISEKAKRIDAAQKKIGTDIGNPAKVEETLEFFTAKKDMDDFLQGLTPASKLRIITGTIGRGMMLASVKSPLLNIGSNLEAAFTESLSRRLSGAQLRGANNKLALDYMKMVNRVYQKTGYDISRMTKLSDSGTSGRRVLGEDTVHSEGPGVVRRTGQFFEDVVFKQLMGAPDVAFSSANFADSTNLNSMKMAKGDKAKATEFMIDSMRLEPKTPEGEILRAQAILDAQVATWTNKTWASRVSEGIRKILNDVTGDFRVGDYVLPFVKTPANVIATGMDYAGGGVIKSLVDTVKAARSGELGSREYLQKLSRNLVRSGLGAVGALVITNFLKDDDFIGAYDPKRAQIEQLRNSTTNSIRFGDKWVSTAWLGPLGIPVTAIMYARKYGDTAAEMGFQYSKAVAGSTLQIPGVADIYDEVKSNAFKQNQSLEEMTGATENYIAEQASSRLMPSILSDIAKSLDQYERVTTGDKLGPIEVGKIKAKIPGLRQTLPIKRNIFGEKLKGEGPISDILFGSRVKTDKETALVKELGRVSAATDKGINFTDWDKSSSKTLSQFKEKVGEAKFNEAKTKYGKLLKERLDETINKAKYKELTDEEKLTIINDIDAEVQAEVLEDFNFKYKKAASKKKIKI